MRFDLAFPVLIESIFGISRCVARNISEGGIFLEMQQPLPLGSTVSVTFEQPGGGTTLVAQGEVKHALCLAYGSPEGTKQLRGVGVRFSTFFAGETEPHLRALPL
jgi:hypothetical protein